MHQEDSIDIDSELDFSIAEYIMKTSKIYRIQWAII